MNIEIINEEWLIVCNMDELPVLAILRESCKRPEDYFNGKAYKVELNPSLTEDELQALLLKERAKYEILEKLI